MKSKTATHGNPEVRIKRVYESPSSGDGTRILVERLWPRGVAKARAAVDLWLKEIAPTSELRKWFAHDTEKWPEFRKRYQKELAGNTEALDRLREAISQGEVTLIYAAHDEAHNSAVVLRDYLESHPSRKRA